MKLLVPTVLVALLVSSVAWGEESAWTVGRPTWINPPELQAQLLLLEKRIEALEGRAKRVDNWGTREMVCDPPQIRWCDGPGCWCGDPMPFDDDTWYVEPFEENPSND